jgi:hypothetical protein
MHMIDGDAVPGARYVLHRVYQRQREAVKVDRRCSITMFEKRPEEFRTIDVLINTAGVYPLFSISDKAGHIIGRTGFVNRGDLMM